MKSVGKSGVTPFKQADFHHWCRCYINKTINVYEKHSTKEWIDPNLLFIDASCGDMDPKEITSPQIFIESLLPHSQKEIPVKLYLIDKNPKNLRSTKKQCVKRYKEKLRKTNIEIFFRGNNAQEPLQDLGKSKYRFGLLYFDPNGFRIEDYTAIQNFLCNNPRIDVILNLNISIMKRVMGAARGFDYKGKWALYKNQDFAKLLKELGKETIWIRDDVRITQKKHIKRGNKFIMISGTNMPNFNPNLKKREHHFVPLNSAQGDELINKYHI